MVHKNEMTLFKVTINNNYKHQFLNHLSKLNNVHLKSRQTVTISKKIQEKDSMKSRIKNLRQNLNNLFKKLNISENDFQDLKISKEDRQNFVINDLYELIIQTLDEINFYTNRINELEIYISRARIELENLKIIKSSYVFLELFHLTRESLTGLNQLNFRVFTTFSKNIENLKTLFDFNSFPCVYQTDEFFPNIYQLEDRTIFYILYPYDKEEELKERINIIHAEEVAILKKYLTQDGINFTRINNEINIVNNTLVKYEKEKKRLRDQNLNKFAAINEVVQNIEEYNWAEHQFEDISSDRRLLRFFIPARKKEEIEKNLIKTFRDKIIIETLDVPKHKEVTEIKDIVKTISKEEKGGDDIRKSAPTIMKNPWFIRPFETLTRMYGTPAYSEIDPTPILWFTFPLIFGLMFGDIGHGMCLIIAGILGGIYFRKRRTIRDLSWIIFYCGIGAVFWGYLYGEFFGGHDFFGYHLHQILIPNPLLGPVSLYNPLEGANVLSIFKFALFIGVIHINIGWLIQFMNYWKQSKKYLAFTDSLIKICLLTGGTFLIFTYGLNLDDWLSPPYPILLVLIPGILLIILKPIGGILGVSYLKKESFGALIGEGSIGTFETALSILSNVASYVRLLALALAHVALMISIQSMVNLLQGEDLLIQILRVIGLIFGNLIVILLEGILVFINSIRLHFYEFFFKFYQGSGTEFFPFYLDNDYSQIVFRAGFEKDLISEEIEKEIETKKTKEDLDEAMHFIEDKFF